MNLEISYDVFIFTHCSVGLPPNGELERLRQSRRLRSRAGISECDVRNGSLQVRPAICKTKGIFFDPGRTSSANASPSIEGDDLGLVSS
ncbi:hypothetical protein CBM2609_U20011 [Cupriavidus taiwanensis]|nr:hypothetical protein CBM2604_U20013 [Cupriavidus taiwanensis]SOZ34511.1 hypothetical protein CBM2609_U20011 [Cupriavidus taiwanensis]SOZ53142.1 hypothetical protein CBM2610_U30003 [Cupriavidus taiwanensis]